MTGRDEYGEVARVARPICLTRGLAPRRVRGPPARRTTRPFSGVLEFETETRAGSKPTLEHLRLLVLPSRIDGERTTGPRSSAPSADERDDAGRSRGDGTDRESVERIVDRRTVREDAPDGDVRETNREASRERPEDGRLATTTLDPHWRSPADSPTIVRTGSTTRVEQILGRRIDGAADASSANPTLHHRRAEPPTSTRERSPADDATRAVDSLRPSPTETGGAPGRRSAPLEGPRIEHRTPAASPRAMGDRSLEGAGAGDSRRNTAGGGLESGSDQVPSAPRLGSDQQALADAPSPANPSGGPPMTVRGRGTDGAQAGSDPDAGADVRGSTAEMPPGRQTDRSGVESVDRAPADGRLDRLVDVDRLVDRLYRSLERRGRIERERRGR